MKVKKNKIESKGNLVELKREYTGFFTSIYVYDSAEKVPLEKVNKMGIKKECDSFKKCYVVFFKDLETKRLLKFSVGKDSQLLSRQHKNDNVILIRQMQNFVRIHYNLFEDYYSGDKGIGLFDLEGLLKIEYPVFSRTQKLLYSKFFSLEDNFEYIETILKLSTLKQKIIAKKDSFVRSFCRCLLWPYNEKLVDYLKYSMRCNLISIARKIVEKRKLNMMEFVFDGLTDEAFLKKNCENIVADTFENNYPGFKELGYPEEIDFKFYKNRLLKFKEKFLNWFKENDKNLKKFNYEKYKKIHEELMRMINKLVNPKPIF